MSERSEMIERVANAIEALSSGEMGSPIYDPQYGSIARAAIAAMREPTGDMCIVGPAWNSDARGIWQAMIDEALK